jgi:hypothetical protein
MVQNCAGTSSQNFPQRDSCAFGVGTAAPIGTAAAQSSNPPVVKGGGGSEYCPTGSAWTGSGDYCINGNLYSCYAGGQPATFKENCGHGCSFGGVNQPDYCTAPPPTTAPPTVNQCNEPVLRGGGGAYTCPVAPCWSGPGNYCLGGNLYSCQYPGSSTSNMVQNCAGNCIKNFPQRDSCALMGSPAPMGMSASMKGARGAPGLLGAPASTPSKEEVVAALDSIKASNPSLWDRIVAAYNSFNGGN